MRVFIVVVCAWASVAADAADRPNILWITSEDNGPHIGAYGDAYADTPNIDQLARMGMRYLNAWSTAPVCAPARTAIITGVYPPSTGSQHMRSETRLPPFMRMFPQILRDAGYYCTNNSKEDYNLVKPGKVWDESSRGAHWSNRAAGQPFFAVFNHGESHEGQIRRRPHTWVHEPANAPLPAYHPDTPETRKDWAQYYDKVTEMDARVGQNIAELEAAGVLDDTIIFYYGDHGPGMPRSKRWTYHSGLHVPLIVVFPKKYGNLAPEGYKPGGTSDRLVGFVDLAPTILSLAGIKPPEYMQGHAFAGPHATPAQQYAYGFRGRMDERYDMVRVVRDERYMYIRNYMPHRIYGQYVHYMFQTPTTQVWKRLYDEGKLSPPKTYFWEPKPYEELYDLPADPHQVNNIVDSADRRADLDRLRDALDRFEADIRDLGFLPESEIHRRADESTPYEMGHDNTNYPLDRIRSMAKRSASLDPMAMSTLREALNDNDSAVRYWAAMGLLMRGEDAVGASAEELRAALEDSAAPVRIVAAEALGRYGSTEDAERAVGILIELCDAKTNDFFNALMALNALDYLDEKAADRLAEIEALPRTIEGISPKFRSYVPRLLDKIVADIEPE